MESKEPVSGQPDNSVRRDLKLEEFQVILSGPAVWSNYIYTTYEPLGIKITFAEKNPAIDLPAYRTAVFIDPGSATALRDLLNDYISRLNNNIAQKNG